MHIKLISSKDEINSLKKNETFVHIAFRPSNVDIFCILAACPKIEAIQIPKSYFCKVSTSIKLFLEHQKIQLLEGGVWGHRKDIQEYYTFPQHVIDRITELKHDGKTHGEIVDDMMTRYHFKQGLASYVVNAVKVDKV